MKYKGNLSTKLLFPQNNKYALTYEDDTTHATPKNIDFFFFFFFFVFSF